MAITVLCYADQHAAQASDESLLEQCLRGDMEAFGQLYVRYERPVFRYALYLLGNEEDAVDVAQETFLRAYQGLHTFRGDARLLTWLLKICANLCRDDRRSRETHHVPLDTIAEVRCLQPSPEHDPHQTVERSEVLQTILMALQSLPASLREIIVLHEIEGLEGREVARIVGCSVGAARIRLFRARRLLKERVLSLLGGE